ncbi:MAG: hypothetical protein MI923_13915 [Phycisphaerales bacterium]|nr:hypothetical protein [Phycisphaerales bacterium]
MDKNINIKGLYVMATDWVSCRDGFSCPVGFRRYTFVTYGAGSGGTISVK